MKKAKEMQFAQSSSKTFSSVIVKSKLGWFKFSFVWFLSILPLKFLIRDSAFPGTQRTLQKRSKEESVRGAHYPIRTEYSLPSRLLNSINKLNNKQEDNGTSYMSI